MAYYYSSYHEQPDNHQYNQSYLDYSSYNDNERQQTQWNSISNGIWGGQDVHSLTLEYSSYDYCTNTRYVQYHDPQFYGYEYQHAPTPSIVGYYYNYNEFPAQKGAKFHDPVSTEFVVSYSMTTEAKDDLDYEEYNPEPYHGGYNISKTYGEPLPPSDETCYPPSKPDPIPPVNDAPFESVPNPYGKDDQKPISDPKPSNGSVGGDAMDEGKGSKSKQGGENSVPISEGKPSNRIIVSQVVEDEKGSESELEEEEEEEEEEDDDDDEEDEEDEDEEEEQLQQEQEQEKVPEKVQELVHEQAQEDLGDNMEEQSDRNEVIRRQIPPGYGLEALDLCEGVFGGYFPCLWKKKQGSSVQCYDTGYNEVGDNGDYCWKQTADYLFGNPNPYGGSMPERGSYGDPIYSYQRHYPQQALCEQVEYGGGDHSWMPNARYYYN